MRWHHLLLTLGLLVVLAPPAPATNLFSRRAKPAATPAEHLQELLTTLRTSTDDRKRLDAAEELRQYDPATSPEIVPALADALRNDRSWAVRYEAVQTLGKVRPVPQVAGEAMDHAATHDGSLRVRWQARSILASYHRSGYHSGPPKEPEKAPPAMAPQAQIPITTQPFLPAPPAQFPAVQTVPQGFPPVVTTAPVYTTAPPLGGDVEIARPMPRGPQGMQTVPVSNQTAGQSPYPQPRMAQPIPNMTRPAATTTAAPIPVTTVPARSAAPPVAVPVQEDGPLLLPQQ